MASLSKTPQGYTVQVVCPDRKRRSIRLGAVNKKTANEIKSKVETLVALAGSGLPMDLETAQWVARIGDDLAAKLAAAGLIPKRASRQLGEFLNAYLEARKADSKPATVVTIHRVIFDLTEHFGPHIDLRDVDAEKAEGFKHHYQQRGLAMATIYRRLKMAKMLFGYAHKLELIPTNPFDSVNSKNHNPPERRQYISAEVTQKVIDVANPTWRTIIALSRFGGLRCPSEVLMLRWEHIDFVSGRMTITSPKTEHLEGRGYRVAPIFAALRPYLEDARELAEPGEEFVVGGTLGAKYRATAQGPGGWVATNLRTVFEKLIRRAGLQQWPKVFHALRASCETDLMQHHPIHVVTAWIGNTPKIALGHYLQTLEMDFEKAIRGGAKSGAVVVQNAVQSGDANDCQEMTKTPETLENKDFWRLLSRSDKNSHSVQMAKEGLEPTRLLGGRF